MVISPDIGGLMVVVGGALLCPEIILMIRTIEGWSNAEQRKGEAEVFTSEYVARNGECGWWLLQLFAQVALLLLTLAAIYAGLQAFSEYL